MTRPRHEIVSPKETPYYHCISRCVRHSFLCGFEQQTRSDYSHRKTWITERLALLCQVFTIDICAYAIMSNHYHLVLHIDLAKWQTLTDLEVAERWGKIYSVPDDVKDFLCDQTMTDERMANAQALLATWRSRLCDLSWYMRTLNEHIARKANKEDECTGRFWEGRFKSQAILDEQGLLACMAYVDLNPLRAGIVERPEDSADISLQSRIEEWHQQQRGDYSAPSKAVKAKRIPLRKLFNPEKPSKNTLPFNHADYLELVDWIGRIQREDKRGAIASPEPPILARLSIEPQQLLRSMQPQRLSKGTVIGRQLSRRRNAKVLNRRFVLGPELAA